MYFAFNLTNLLENKTINQNIEKNKNILIKKVSPIKKPKKHRHSSQSISPMNKTKDKFLYGQGTKKFRFNYKYFKYQ